MINIDYVAPPTCAKFIRSEAFGRLIAGPVGSGKTTACIMELLKRSCAQLPAKDGNRYTRFVVVRQTLKQLKDTVVRDTQQWLNQVGEWRVSESTFHLNFADVRSEWIFVPLENAEDQARLLSMQLTGAFLSECIEMNLDVIGPISGRLGRYPSAARGVPTWFGMIADTNFPTEMTPWHNFMENPPPNWSIFKQPSGLSSEAENLNWLPQTPDTISLPLNDPRRLAQGRKYYERLIETHGADHAWVKRYVYAQYGDDPSGLAVFKESFRPDFHIVDNTELVPGYPILVGQDFGRTPWSIICQVDPWGRLLVHEEVPAHNIGLENHVNYNLKPRLFRDKYLGYRVAIVGDPAGKAKDSHSEESSFELLGRLGLPAVPAPTNDIDPRLRAVEALLARQTNGGPTLLINRQGCPFLCRAMSGGYRYTKTRAGGLRALPDKDDPEGFSHVADCLQYVAMAVHGNMMPYIYERLRPPRKRKTQGISAAGWT